MNPTVAAYTDVQLVNAILRAQDIHRKLCIQLVHAGRGDEPFTVIQTKTDDLSIQIVNVATTLAELYNERDRRQLYQAVKTHPDPRHWLEGGTRVTYFDAVDLAFFQEACTRAIDFPFLALLQLNEEIWALHCLHPQGIQDLSRFWQIYKQVRQEP